MMRMHIVLALLLAALLLAQAGVIWAAAFAAIGAAAVLLSAFLDGTVKLGKAFGRGVKQDLGNEWNGIEGSKPKPAKFEDAAEIVHGIASRLADESKTEKAVKVFDK
ncbi:MAG: hypothetical protein V1676_03720 [Candidatus Diapherotrites archaeon]